MPGHLLSAEPSTSHTINVSQKDLGAELLEAEVEEGKFASKAKGGGDGGLGAFDAFLKVEGSGGGASEAETGEGSGDAFVKN
ncbi:hypothetical protein ACFXTN_040130 [Malus domestica]